MKCQTCENEATYKREWSYRDFENGGDIKSYFEYKCGECAIAGNKICIEVKCANCGKRLDVLTSFEEGAPDVFCSRGCAIEWLGYEKIDGGNP